MRTAVTVILLCSLAICHGVHGEECRSALSRLCLRDDVDNYLRVKNAIEVTSNEPRCFSLALCVIVDDDLLSDLNEEEANLLLTAEIAKDGDNSNPQRDSSLVGRLSQHISYCKSKDYRYSALVNEAKAALDVNLLCLAAAARDDICNEVCLQEYAIRTNRSATFSVQGALLKDFPDNGMSKVLIARALIERQEHKMAIEMLKEALRSDSMYFAGPIRDSKYFWAPDSTISPRFSERFSIREASVTPELVEAVLLIRERQESRMPLEEFSLYLDTCDDSDCDDFAKCLIAIAGRIMADERATMVHVTQASSLFFKSNKKCVNRDVRVDNLCDKIGMTISDINKTSLKYDSQALLMASVAGMSARKREREIISESVKRAGLTKDDCSLFSSTLP